MKKIFLKTVFILSLVLLQSCDKDFTNPTASLVTDTKLISPTQGTVLTLNSNFFTAPAITVKWSSSDFGYSASVNYVLQIVKSTDNFDSPQIVPLGTFNENSNAEHQSTILTSVFNAKLLAAGVSIGSTSDFKMRVFGQPSGQLATSTNGVKTYSQEVAFTCNTYDPISETPKIYVIGNFGAASTYADWDINTTGTSNSPLLYSPTKDAKYNGFVWMNINAPHFQFANPIDASLNIYGLGSTAGNLAKAPSILPANDIIVPYVPSQPITSGPGTYYITANLNSAADANKYTVVKSRFFLKGGAAGSTAKYLEYDTNPASPYYRMYTNTNVTLNQGLLKIQMKEGSLFSPAPKLDALGYDDTPVITISPNASAQAKNKVKIGTGAFTVSAGNYTVVLDVRNSADFNIRFITN